MKFEEITGKMSGIEFLVPFIETGKFDAKEYNRRILELCKAICVEKGLPFTSIKDVINLPADTELTSEEVIGLFNELNDWLETQHVYSES